MGATYRPGYMWGLFKLLSYGSTVNVRLSQHTVEGGRVHGNRGTTRGATRHEGRRGTQDSLLLALDQDCLSSPRPFLRGPRSRSSRPLWAILLVGDSRAARSSLSARLGLAREASPSARSPARLRSGPFGWRCVRLGPRGHAASLSLTRGVGLGFYNIDV